MKSPPYFTRKKPILSNLFQVLIVGLFDLIYALKHTSVFQHFEYGQADDFIDKRFLDLLT